jgi:hypothetical protein
MKEFEKTFQDYADAVTAQKPAGAQNAAMQVLLMAGEEALRILLPACSSNRRQGILRTAATGWAPKWPIEKFWPWRSPWATSA